MAPNPILTQINSGNNNVRLTSIPYAACMNPNCVAAPSFRLATKPLDCASY